MSPLARFVALFFPFAVGGAVYAFTRSWPWSIGVAAFAGLGDTLLYFLIGPQRLTRQEQRMLRNPARAVKRDGAER